MSVRILRYLLPLILLCTLSPALSAQKRLRNHEQRWGSPLYTQADARPMAPIFRNPKKSRTAPWDALRASRLRPFLDCSSLIRVISFNSGNLEYKSVEAPRLYQFDDFYLNFITGYTIRLGLVYRFDRARPAEEPLQL